MYQNDKAKCLTGEVRLSYANLVQPREPLGGGEPKYSVTLLIPKTDTATKADLDAAIKAVAQDAVSKKWGGVMPQFASVIHDGDGPKQDGSAFGAECQGHWVMSASSYNKPQVVDQSNIQCQLAPEDIYSGMYARVTVRFFAYNSHGKKGVGCGLGNVMKTRDGEPLGGAGASAASDFAGVGVAAGAPAPGVTGSGYQVSTPYNPSFPQQKTVTYDPITGEALPF